MSNMNTNRNGEKVKGKQSAQKLKVNQNQKKLLQEEYGSEFHSNFHTASAKENNSSGKKGINQPVSERTAWN